MRDKDEEGEVAKKRRRTVLPSSRQVHVLPNVEQVNMEEIKMEVKDRDKEVKDDYTAEVELRKVKNEANMDIKEGVKMEFKEGDTGEGNMEVKDDPAAEVEFRQEVKDEVKMELGIKQENVYGAKKEEVAETLVEIEGKGAVEEYVGQFMMESKVLKMEEKVLLDASSSSNLLLSSSFELPAQLEVELGAEMELGVELGAEVELGLDGDQVDPDSLFRPYLI